MKYISVKEVLAMDRRASREFGIPSILLMENAGRAVAEEVLKFRPRKALLFCGNGNNGGDGFVAARHLTNHGVECSVVHFQKPAVDKNDSVLNFNILKKMKVPLFLWTRLTGSWRGALLRGTDLIVDAIFGIGISRTVDEPYKTVIEKINLSGKPVLSVDVPSGMNADTGKPLGACVRARKTVTLAFPKLGFKQKASRTYTGQIILADISIPAKLRV